MREGAVVPPGVIPAKAWGLGFEAASREELAAQDPFGDCGLRLDIPDGMTLEVQDVIDVTGAEHVVLFSGICAWVELNGSAAPEEVQGRWAGWLDAEGPPPLD